jgi:hypothetical protein
LAAILSHQTTEEMNIDLDDLDNLEFDSNDPIHLISKLVGDVLDEFDFDIDLVDEAKRLFVLYEPIIG